MEQDMYRKVISRLEGPAVIGSPEAICYTTGFYTTARRPGQIGRMYGVITEAGVTLVSPANWAEEVMRQTAGNPWVRVIPCDPSPKNIGRHLINALREAGNGSKIGIELSGMDILAMKALEEGFPEAVIEDITADLNRARMIKTPQEIQALKKPAALASKAMEYAKTLVRPGIREFEMAAELEYFMRRGGSDGTPFTMKALSGPNTAVTINIPGQRAVREGDLVLFDFGAVVDHYASDWTRTFVCGKASREQKELYQLVRTIEQECIRMIKPGLPIQSLMDKAFETASSHPFGRWFKPYLGHSIGLSSQEWPALEPKAFDCLEENMVITIEPGIYIPEMGGIRMEDEVLVTREGYQILTGLENEIFEIY